MPCARIRASASNSTGRYSCPTSETNNTTSADPGSGTTGWFDPAGPAAATKLAPGNRSADACSRTWTKELAPWPGAPTTKTRIRRAAIRARALASRSTGSDRTGEPSGLIEQTGQLDACPQLGRLHHHRHRCVLLVLVTPGSVRYRRVVSGVRGVVGHRSGGQAAVMGG